MEPVTECSYIGCEKQPTKGLRLHPVPVKNSELCVKWLINSGREEFLSEESEALVSMNLAICSDHFQDNDYLDENKILKEDAVPRQYWDHGYSEELGEIKEVSIDQQLPNYSDDSMTGLDLESDSDMETTDDEFRTQLGNHIEVLLNSIQNFDGRSREEKKLKFDESLRGFYKKLNSKGKLYSKGNNDFLEFKKATKNMCRTCAEKKKNLVDVDEEVADSNISVLTKLKLLIEIKDHDVLPKKICQECLTKLEQSYEFFQQIYRADNALRDMLFECDRSSKTISNNKGKCNGRTVSTANFKTKNGSNGNKIGDICSEVNDMPFQSIFKSTGVLNNEADGTGAIDVYESNNFYQKINCGNNTRDKNNIINSETYSSENTENTVSYLLSDFSNDDAELSWLDVVGAMEKRRKSDASKLNKIFGKSPSFTVQISCKYCDKSFKLRRQLKTHITMKHLRPTNCVCEYCNICCRSREHLLKHIKKAHSEPLYKCNDCNEKFGNKENLCLHIQRIHSEIGSMAETDIAATPHPDQIYTCYDCQETFSSKKTLCNHIHRLHPPFAYACTICKSMMFSEEDTYEHMRTHNHSPLFPCLDCGRMFYSTERLEKHKITHAKSMAKKRKRVWFHCQLCDASYSIVEELIKHIDTHSPEDWENYRNKILYCGECNARIIGKEKFRIHKMRYHLAKRGDFICLLCDKVTQEFKSLGDYKKHVDSHSNELKRSAPQKYRCEHCNKAFESDSHRINHVNSFHSDLIHSHPICNVKFNSNENLKDHIDESHKPEEQQVGGVQDIKEEQISPRVCEKESSTGEQKNDDKEVKVHQEEFGELDKSFSLPEQYSCDRCNVEFSSAQILKQHFLATHKDAEQAASTEASEKHFQSESIKVEETLSKNNVQDIVLKETQSAMENASSESDLKLELESTLKEDLQTHKKDGLPYKCQYCKEQFENDDIKKTHEFDHHLNNTKSNGGHLSSQDHE